MLRRCARAFDVVHAQGLCAAGYGAIRARDPLLQRVPFIANPHGLEENTARPTGASGSPTRRSVRYIRMARAPPTARLRPMPARA
ncbi:MAG: glycosyltransferase [Kouleothrix sp.]